MKALWALTCVLAGTGWAQKPGAAIQQYVVADGLNERVVIAHVRVIDGTGAAPLEDQSVTLEHGKILSVATGGAVCGSAHSQHIHSQI